jgi:hypothetical protein
MSVILSEADLEIIKKCSPSLYAKLMWRLPLVPEKPPTEAILKRKSLVKIANDIIVLTNTIKDSIIQTTRLKMVMSEICGSSELDSDHQWLQEAIDHEAVLERLITKRE